MRSKIFVLGVTGGIGTGKSTASAYFKKRGLEVIDADEVSKRLMEVGTPTYNNIVSEFGKEIVSKDGSIDRRKLAGIVFNDRQSLIVLQSLLADSLEEDLIDRFKNLSEEKAKPFVVLEAPVLYEYGAEYLVDYVLLVTATEEQQIYRVIARNKMTRDEVKSRIDSQVSTEEKVSRADMVIENNGSIVDFENKLAAAYDEISLVASRRLEG